MRITKCSECRIHRIHLIQGLIEVFCLTVPNFLGQPGQAKNPFSEGPKKTSREDFATQFMARNESDKIAEQTPGLGIQTKKIRAQKEEE